jgi:L-iditol 2-dehydrogenase
MRVATVFGPDEMRIEKKPVPLCPSDSMLIKVESCAICGSDLKIYKTGDFCSQYPIVLGHEIAWTVEEAGSGIDEYYEGERVCVAPGHGCGECKYCRMGFSNMCVDPNPSIGYASDGGFAQFMVPPPNVVKLRFVNPIPRDSPSITHLCQKYWRAASMLMKTVRYMRTMWCSFLVQVRLGAFIRFFQRYVVLKRY